MTRAELARRLHEATTRTLAFAREIIVNDVPDDHRFDIIIKPHGALHDGPIVDPLLQDLWDRTRGIVRELTAEQVIAALWHDGRVPEWIDISLDAIELPRDDRWRVVSMVELRCSRTLADDTGLWHANEGIPPFHILGPALPDGWVERHTDADGRFDPKGRKFLLSTRRKR